MLMTQKKVGQCELQPSASLDLPAGQPTPEPQSVVSSDVDEDAPATGLSDDVAAPGVEFGELCPILTQLPLATHEIWLQVVSSVPTTR